MTSRHGRPYRAGRPVWMVVRGQPHVPWADYDSPETTYMRPNEMTYWARRHSQVGCYCESPFSYPPPQGAFDLPIVNEHANKKVPAPGTLTQELRGTKLAPQDIIGKGTGALVDGKGNAYQLLQLDPSKREAASYWEALEKGKSIGGSYWTDYIQDASTNKVIDLLPTHFGLGPFPNHAHVGDTRAESEAAAPDAKEERGSWVWDAFLAHTPLTPPPPGP